MLVWRQVCNAANVIIGYNVLQWATSSRCSALTCVLDKCCKNKDNKCRKVANVDSDFRFSLVVRPWTTALEHVLHCGLRPLAQKHDQRCLYISPVMVIFHLVQSKITVYTSCLLVIRGHLLGWGPTYSNNHLVKTLATRTGIKAQ